MYNNDFLMRQIENLCKSLANTIFKRNINIFEAVDSKGSFSQNGFFYHKLKKMIYDGEINESEDMLFNEIEKNPTEDNLKIALQFYKDLQSLSEDFLIKCDFSREEILDGVKSIKQIYL